VGPHRVSSSRLPAFGTSEQSFRLLSMDECRSRYANESRRMRSRFGDRTAHPPLWHRLLGGPVSQYGRLCHGGGAHEGGERRRSVLMLPTLLDAVPSATSLKVCAREDFIAPFAA